MDGFRTDLGMTPDGPAFGEETDFQMRARERNPEIKIYYDPELTVGHIVHPEKMRLSSVANRNFIDGRFAYRVHSAYSSQAVAWHRWATRRLIELDQRARRSWFWAGLEKALLILMGPLLGFQFAVDASLMAVLRRRASYPDVRNYWYEKALPKLRRLGWVYEQFVS